MTKTQLYIIIIITTLAILGWLGFNNNSTGTDNLPGAIGDPLELLLVKNTQDFNNDFYKNLKETINIDIGPSPQPEQLLSIMEIDSEKFTGILKRHQNLLFIEKSDVFSISFKMDVFALNQLVVLIEAPPEIILKEKELIIIVEKIKEVETERLVKKFKKTANKNLSDYIDQTHGFHMHLPKDFFVAHKDSNITWIRRETPKISQGILITNLENVKTDFFNRASHHWHIGRNKWSAAHILEGIDSIIGPHILGPIDGSYMVTDKRSLEGITTSSSWREDRFGPTTRNFCISKGARFVDYRIQSLWRMENDFMGGIYVAYLIPKPYILIYTYLYAPNEKKAIPLLQLEAIMRSGNLDSPMGWEREFDCN